MIRSLKIKDKSNKQVLIELKFSKSGDIETISFKSFLKDKIYFDGRNFDKTKVYFLEDKK